jgi:signal peptidase I
MLKLQLKRKQRRSKFLREGFLNIDGLTNPKPETAADSNKSAALKEKAVYGFGCFFELTKWLIVIVILGALIHFFVMTIFIVDGLSMEPNFHDGQIILANRFQYLFGTPERGDVAILKFPGDPNHKKYIKRIIGLPGETVTIKDGSVYINNKKLIEPYISNYVETLPNQTTILKDKDYFLMGDNRPNSSDSRIWGVAEKRYLIGKAWVILWPFGDFGKVTHYQF